MNIEKINQKLHFHHNIPCRFQVAMMKCFIFWSQSSFMSVNIWISVTTPVMYWITTQENCFYSGYPENVYDDLSHENEQKKGEINMNGSDRIVSMLYIKKRHSHMQHILFL